MTDYESKYTGEEVDGLLDKVGTLENPDLSGYATKDELGTKQNTISDLETIRSGAAKGATALQSYTEQYKGTITGVSANGASIATSGVANIPAASTSAYGVTKLSSATDSTSTSLAATASAVKAAYDLANSYKGTVTGVKVNGSTKSPSSGTVDLGNVVTSIKINGSTITPSAGVVDLGTISGDSSSGGSSSGTTTNEFIELNPSQSNQYISGGTCVLKCNNGQDYEFRVDDSCRIIIGLVDGDTYGALSFLTTTGSIYWANNNEPIFEDGKMIELSFYRIVIGAGIMSMLATWASYDAGYLNVDDGAFA